MEQDIRLDFFRQLLKGLYVSSTILADASVCIPAEVDLGLRQELFGEENYVQLLANTFSPAKERTIYRFFDEYGCHYIFLGLTGQSYLFIGPYLLELPTGERIRQRAAELGLTPEQQRFLEHYYNGLPLIEDENYLLTMTNTLASQLWGPADSYAMEYVQYVIPDQRRPIPMVLSGGTEGVAAAQLENLERIYASEKLLMEAVSRGKLHQVTAVAASVVTNGLVAQRADSLRDRKNDLIILKTLLRKAAEYGGVHPLHIHRVSEQFAEDIENIRTIKQSLSLQETMIRSYCQLVKHHSLSRYSYYVGRVITLVQYDLTADLSLKAIAAKLNVNPSYLSDLFHREYGCTLTAFINQERIQRAIHLLRTTSRPVQQIGAECGIPNTNYFIKLFKKHTGMTPNQYRERS